MRKLSAILLIALFVFNLIGYRIMFNYQQQQSDTRLEASLDKQDYNNADLITIKVPLSLPYVSNQNSFERINGEITVGGKILKYVKRKIVDGNLVLLCLPDNDKMRIESAKDEFFKYANDLVQNNQSKKPGNKTGVFKNLLPEYDVNAAVTASPACRTKLGHIAPLQPAFLPSSHHQLPEQPPEV